MVHLECVYEKALQLQIKQFFSFLFLCIEINYLHSREIAFNILETSCFVTILLLGNIVQ